VFLLRQQAKTRNRKKRTDVVLLLFSLQMDALHSSPWDELGDGQASWLGTGTGAWASKQYAQAASIARRLLSGNSTETDVTIVATVLALAAATLVFGLVFRMFFVTAARIIALTFVFSKRR
jgi:hypothetical protein